MKTGIRAKMLAVCAMFVSAEALADYNCAVLAPTTEGAQEYGQILGQKAFADADMAQAQLIYDDGTTAYAALYDQGFLTVAAVNKSTGKALLLASGDGSEVILMDAVNSRAIICKKASPEEAPAPAPTPNPQALRKFSL